MRGSYNEESNPNSMATSPQSLRQPYRPNSVGLERSTSAMVTPCGSHSGGSMMDRWMARGCMPREAEHVSDVHGEADHVGNARVQISPVVRAEVSKEIYGILRDNLPPALEADTSPDELALIADSIERKLHVTASSPRAYCSRFSTLEFRITALATAVLIHSDRGRDHRDREDDHRGSGNRGVSDTCARLSAAARNSLVYCVMVLVSYEKRNLDGSMLRQRRRRRMARLENDWENESVQSRGRNKGRSPVAMMEEMYSRRSAERHLRELEKQYPHCHFDEPTSSADIDPSARDDLQIDAGGDSKKVQPFPPSA